MSDTPIAWKAFKLAFKSFFYVFKALWKGLTYGFRAWKKHKENALPNRNQ